MLRVTDLIESAVHTQQLHVSSLLVFKTLLLQIDKIIVLFVWKGEHATKCTTVVYFVKRIENRKQKKPLISVA